MRIVHLLNSLGDANGITNVVVDLATAQVSAGDSVMICAKPGVYSDVLKAGGVAVSPVDFTMRKPLAVLNTIHSLRSVLRKFHPDIIHVHTITPLILCRAMCFKEPIVATIHNEWSRRATIMGLASLAVGVSEATTSSMERRGIPASRLRTVPNGVVGSPRRGAGITAAQLQHPAVLFVGSFSRRKGVDVLLNAFATLGGHIPKIHLYLIGRNSGLNPALMADNLGIAESVHVVGLADPFPYYMGADIFVLPSRSEPFALVLLEAMEFGLPLLGARVGGIEELLDLENGGLTFESESSVELANLIVRVLEDPIEHSRLSQRSRELAPRFSTSVMASKYKSIYLERAK